MFGRSFGTVSGCVAGLPTLKFNPRTHLDISFLVMVAVCGVVHSLGQI
ncbi:hypothetical protein TIFTF001_031025 [Ficus carica]|uniref:Uncharacterized protein n=1 Tax=Ficus carica TaxID=3494 RepID=A0AA88J3N8_FICCA|nr:hypothetical protein TIFTF001_031025 [Ficus carica]